jgi:hypothetical protein
MGRRRNDPIQENAMLKLISCGALLIVGLASGCASTGGQHDSTSATAVAAPAAGAVLPPLGVTPGSAKRLVLNMTGPDTVTKARDWPAFQQEWKATFADHAKEAGMAFDVQAGDAHATGEAGTLLNVYVNDYRMVGIGSRIFFGVMTGNAYIDAKATYTDLNDGTSFGERAYNTSSTAWAGVFGKMTPQQVDAIAERVFAELASAAPH